MDRIVPNVGWYPEVVGTPFVPSQYRPDLDLGASIMPKDHVEPEKKEKSRFQRARPPPLQLQREYADQRVPSLPQNFQPLNHGEFLLRGESYF